MGSEAVPVAGPSTPLWVTVDWVADLYTHIEGNLWMGGCHRDAILPDDFLYVVSLYTAERYRIGERTTRFEWLMYDSNDVDVEVVERASDVLVDCLNEGKTLVHCQAGLNRSGIVAALALIKMGRTPREAIGLLREKRDEGVLCNYFFRDWLLAYEP